ncbi:MAG: ATP-dependent DNA helicase RecG [Fibrobacteres bacterium]|nr:ATP-dependent DNA helicase RecG [Fibrobacterota bacterium]
MKKDPVTLSNSLTALAGIGNKRAEVFREKGIFSVEDLLKSLPRDYLDRTKITPVKDLAPETFAVVVVDVISVYSDGRKRMQVKTADKTGYIDFIFFGGLEFLKDRFTAGDRVHAWGRITEFRGTFQISHPEFRVLKDGEEPEKGIFPLYPGSADLKDVFTDSKVIASAVKDALNRSASVYHENLPESIIKKRKYPPLKVVYSSLHFPASLNFMDMERKRERLRYEEAFLLLYKIRSMCRKNNSAGTAIPPGSRFPDLVYANSGFLPTDGQKQAINEIEADIFSPKKMNRLLQGDVGSGKTFVCAVCAAHVLESGRQVLLMAPTEILARQHAAEMKRLFKGVPVEIELMISEMSSEERENTVDKARKGAPGIWVGTHALISSSSEFANAGLVIIDEQHRFGVRQRMALREKGFNPDMLVVTATPIPRTLALTMYGDLSVSVIAGMPPGRQIVKTYRVGESKREDMYKFLSDRIDKGGRAFVVLPLIDSGESKSELKSVTDTVEQLNKHDYLKGKVGFVHGKLKTEEKINAIEAFREGSLPILVSTTVIEVGIDVPDADIIIIEHPERFGLAQLHQLRGRVGRGKKESFCFLLTRPNENEEVYARLDGFVKTSDGFEIAELDFANRGAGELSGLNQSGFPEFKFLSLQRDRHLIQLAREDAEELLDNPGFMSADEMKRLDAALKIFDGLRGEILTTA